MSYDDKKPSIVPKPPKEITSAELMGDDREIVIRHGPEIYRLRITRNGKLILSK